MSGRKEQHWTIVEDGAVIGQVITGGPHPRDEGVDFDEKTMRAHKTDGQADPAAERWDGKAWVADDAKIDARLHARIDAEAGAARLRFITDVPGQAAVYERKEREARAWLALAPGQRGKAAAMADYPFLTAEALAQAGLTVTDIAQAIVASADKWTAAGSAIEGARIGAKRAVSEAATREKKEKAAVVDWDAAIAGAGKEAKP